MEAIYNMFGFESEEEVEFFNECVIASGDKYVGDAYSEGFKKWSESRNK